MNKFYFTYGSSGQPFFGGWTEVLAQDKAEACKAFRVVHPDKTKGLLNCCDVYTEEQFAATVMGKLGSNLGHGCREHINAKEILKGANDK